jgi:hypothetical protein
MASHARARRAAAHDRSTCDLILNEIDRRGLEATPANIFEVGVRLGLRPRGAANLVDVIAIRRDQA